MSFIVEGTMRNYKAILENEYWFVSVLDGAVEELYEKADKQKINNVLKNGSTGIIHYTLKSDNIREMNYDGMAMPYYSRKSIYNVSECEDNVITCTDTENGFVTKYSLDKNHIVIESWCNNDEISEFSMSFDLNFMGNRGTSFKNQFLPSSPYTSYDGQYMYCIMNRCEGKKLAIVMEDECAGWKIEYSYECSGHYINGFRVFSDFDQIYETTNRHHMKLRIVMEESIELLQKEIASIYKVPYITNIISGGFCAATVEPSCDTDYLDVISPSGKHKKIEVIESVMEIPMDEYGIYTIVPYADGQKGLNTTTWYGEDFETLFRKSCDSICAPYHNDYNLCEGGMYIHAMILYMMKYNDMRYDAFIRKELAEIMGEDGVNVPRRTILPYKTDEFKAYHISGSDRIQEQFNGITILMDAYRLYGEQKYLEFAVSSLLEIAENWIDANGMIWINGRGDKADYTTVCAPVITIADMANLLREIGDKRYELFEGIAVKVAEYLVERGENFPTEGALSETKDTEMEDGSISCTALSVLYVCKNIKYDDKYIRFAEKILQLHRTWTIYTPDARMYQSSFRWWETIWEGDGEGPAICAGHAWSLWKAEALFWYGILTQNREAFRQSWNGFITNFAKINTKGESYSCYEADYIRGGGYIGVKRGLFQLKGENIERTYKIAHNYPMHKDNSLSRYVWNVYARTWDNESLKKEIACSLKYERM